MKKVVVVGAGIIGMSIAVELAQSGAEVVVLDKSKVGFGCSYGNAGWMTPCFAMPLPMPGMLLKSVKWLLNPESPLYIRPEFNMTLLRWLWDFTLSMNWTQAERAIASLVELSVLSLEKYKQLAQEFPQEIGFEQKGLLMIGQTKEGVHLATEELSLVNRFGVSGKKMSKEEIQQLEPALKDNFLGGVYFQNEAHAEPLQVVQTLAKKAQKLGVQILDFTEAIDFETTDGKIHVLKTTRGNMIADEFVFALGSWSLEWARKFQLRVPILGGKGYSMILPKLAKQPSHPIMVVDKKIAITPRQNSIRLAGTLELVRQDFSITQRRVNAILRGSKTILHVPEEPQILETWRGLRPCTPDGVPMIGYHHQIKNLFLAAGHQMLGLQSGIGTGVLASQMILGKTPFMDPKIFNVNRF